MTHSPVPNRPAANVYSEYRANFAATNVTAEMLLRSQSR